jgi:hypothetical protein
LSPRHSRAASHHQQWDRARPSWWPCSSSEWFRTFCHR